MKYGSIAAGDKTTVNAAMEILKDGGNAFDAAVCAVFTSMTSEYTLTGACGGGVMLAYPKESEPIVFDFFVHTPEIQSVKNLDFFRIAVDFGPATQFFHIGKGSVAVPGNTIGLLHIHSRLGSLPLSRVLEPAIRTAKSGAIINNAHEYLFKILDPILSHTKTGETLFKPNGKRIKAGERFSNPDFANFLEQIIVEGSNFIYNGDLTENIDDFMGNGGLLTRKDLSNYEVIERTPLKIDFNGKTIITNPMPSPGGTLIAFALKIISWKFPGEEIDNRLLTLVMRLVQTARSEIISAKNKKNSLAEILSPSYFKRYLDLFDSKISVKLNKEKPGSGSTTHMSIIDSQGNAASVTTTNGEGCGYIIPGTGIMMNNILGEEDLNLDGFHNWETTKRMETMMSPTIVIGDLGPELVLGSGGSNRIRSAITQVILNKFTKNMNLDEAIQAPRIHLEENIIHCESGINIKKLNFPWLTIHHWHEKNLFFGGVNAVTPTNAVGDTRRSGYGLVR
ncbi:MAG: gamma-glutamyltransferase [Candidatus Marinimicrobia bacterium]|nr:gamma-glutamyltransferase [Candidatus Neomarinimicrobiota bacterium]